jgi:hypothetical protein
MSIAYWFSLPNFDVAAQLETNPDGTAYPNGFHKDINHYFLAVGASFAFFFLVFYFLSAFFNLFSPEYQKRSKVG